MAACLDHGPEVEYLVNGYNGVIVSSAESVEAYTAAVLHVVRDRSKLRRLADGCRSSAQKYTVEEMVERFAPGVCSALELG